MNKVKEIQVVVKVAYEDGTVSEETFDRLTWVNVTAQKQAGMAVGAGDTLPCLTLELSGGGPDSLPEKVKNDGTP